MLSVDPGVLREQGAVSGEVAERMSVGVAQLLNSKASLAITGVAGPAGGSLEKPVGTVWIAASCEGQVYSKKLSLRGNRERVRVRACWELLNFFRESFIIVGIDKKCQ